MRILSIIGVFALFFLSSCLGEYRDHIEREHQNLIISQTNTGIFESDIRMLPDLEVLENLIEEIDQAKKRIWIELYTWTENDTLSAVIRAKKRGVDVRVILEGNVYRTPWINNDTIKDLDAANIEYIYADNKRYTFTHIKTWMIDDTWCVGTGNWSYTSFTKNREFISCSRDKAILENLEEIFLSDFAHKRPYFRGGLDSRIGLAPENIRPWIYGHIEGAEKNIILYNQTISDPEILSILTKKALSGVKVELCEAYREVEEGKNIIGIPKEISYTSSKKPYLHAKVFLIDDERVILGSANMTQNALDNNREILIDLGKNRQKYLEIFSLYQNDCKSPNRE